MTTVYAEFCHLASFVTSNYTTDTINVLVAVSGGKDSIGLLSTLVQEKDPSSLYTFFAGYVNHGVQGKQEQEKEYEIVLNACQTLHVPLKHTTLATTAYAEDTLRKMRYEALCCMADEIHAPCIVTAHHVQDVYENVMLRLFSYGCWQGVSGIPARREITYKKKKFYILRPALKIKPDALHNKNLMFHYDKTNLDTSYKRNAFRIHVTKAIEENFPRAVSKVAEFSKQQAQVRKCISLKIPRWLQCHGSLWCSWKAFTSISTLEQQYMLFEGANAMGIAHVSASFLKECLRFMPYNIRPVQIQNTILKKRGNGIIWKKYREKLENDTKEYYSYNRENIVVSKGLSLQYASEGRWTVLEKKLCNTSMHGVLYEVNALASSAYITFPCKSDYFLQAGEKINIRSVLVNSCMHHRWQDVPLLCDKDGVFCVAGATMLGKTLFRSPTFQTGDLVHPAIICIAYSKLYIN